MNDELLMFRKSVQVFKLVCRLPVTTLMSVHSFRGGDDSMTENPIARMWVVSRVERICAGANEIMMEMTGTSR